MARSRRAKTVSIGTRRFVLSAPDDLSARVGGELDRDGNTDFNRLSCVFLTATESALAAKAGPGGLEMLVMQFPKGS